MNSLTSLTLKWQKYFRPSQAGF